MSEQNPWGLSKEHLEMFNDSTTPIPDPPPRSIDVLNHGFVRLVDYMGSDLSIVRAARVSYAADWRTGENEKSDKKLIGFLWKNKHTSPFEAVEFQFEIKCPLFIARQWHRHRTQAYNEISARYTELPEEFYVPEREQITAQSLSNKQGRTEEVVPNADFIRGAIDQACSNAFSIYHILLKEGCPRELARMVLPNATYTRYFAKANLRNWLHFLDLRLHPHAQWEIREYAKAIVELIKPIVPVTMEYFLKEGYPNV